MRKLKKVVSILLSIIMIVSLFNIVPFTANAAGGVEYIYRSWNADTQPVVDETKTCSSYTELSERSSDELEAGWYVVSSDLFIDSRLSVGSGTVNLILEDGAKLNVHRGIGVAPGTTLNIYGQSQGTGKLVVVFDPGDSRNDDNAMIGGTGSGGNAGDINIYGGVFR